jgi:putative sigma-54 modulation protein
VKGKNMAIDDALREQVVHKMRKLDKYLDLLQEIEVEICHEKTRDAGSRNHVEATTHVAGRTLRVATENGDVQAAVDEAVDRLYRQLNRKKERMKSHHATRLAEALPADTSTASKLPLLHEQEGDERQPVIHVERLDVKPQFEDEAVLEMDAQGWGFFVFLNARTEEVNVLYRRDDGTYGLIEPRLA